MPGRSGDLDRDIAEAERRGISRVVCLTPRKEVGVKSRQYAEALRWGTLPWPVDFFPIENRGVPKDRDAFKKFILGLAHELRFGAGLLLHCGEGIGRTGTVAICLLIALGSSPGQAEFAVRRAGSYPERPEQRDLIAWFAENYSPVLP
jgi:hypothetical protein